ncbi:DUF6049 family protein [Actinomadura madurae]|uniref:DUF6049 family protein n=1 Tax=Actinomadura madurae TaxID=1993 RepID=UPI0020D23B4C|nr:DUF6049 family protein [Actinomadura madurae]MCQ0017648.1 DUF6049 family protein [Actinomadura madurae]
MRTVQRVAALAALLPCLAMAAPAALAPPAGARPPTRAQALARAQVALALTKVTPKTVGENSKIEISGVAKNRTDGQLPGLTLRLRYSAQPVTSRIQLDQIAKGQPSALPNVGPQQPLAEAAGPGVKQNWTFRTSTRQLGLRAPAGTPGVYPVGVEVLNSAQQVVGGLTTFLTLMPKQRRFKPVAVGWIVPLIDRMHRTNDQTFIDDRLTTDLSPGGRLRRLVDAAAGTNTPSHLGDRPRAAGRRAADGGRRLLRPGARREEGHAQGEEPGRGGMADVPEERLQGRPLLRPPVRRPRRHRPRPPQDDPRHRHRVRPAQHRRGGADPRPGARRARRLAGRPAPAGPARSTSSPSTR